MDARGSTALEAELDGFAGSAGLASLGDAIRAALPARVGSASDSMIDLSGMRAEFTSGLDRTDTIRMLTIMQ
jgi:hypothetical protein